MPSFWGPGLPALTRPTGGSGAENYADKAWKHPSLQQADRRKGLEPPPSMVEVSPVGRAGFSRQFHEKWLRVSRGGLRPGTETGRVAHVAGRGGAAPRFVFGREFQGGQTWRLAFVWGGEA